MPAPKHEENDSTQTQRKIIQLKKT